MAEASADLPGMQPVGRYVDLIPVTDLKQWAYCRRIVYYHRVLSLSGPATFKMREAVAAQDVLEALEMRRNVAAYGLTAAQRHLGIWLQDETIGLSGKTDLLLETPDRVAVVDFKLMSGEVGENHRMQLAGYSLLAERRFGRPAEVAFLYRIPDQRVFPVLIDAALRERVQSAITAIRELSRRQECPDATSVRGRCVECEYANYCGDVW